jgi:N-acetyl-gamma-glutamyl-phosphate reductase
MLRVFICGGSGYTGGELIRILSNHPEIVITGVTSERSAGKTVGNLFPHLRSYSNLVYEHLNPTENMKKADLFFMALPHGESQRAVDFFFQRGKKVVDLSADFRLRDPLTYEKFITCRIFSSAQLAVYGCPTLQEKDKKAALIAKRAAILTYTQSFACI